MPEWNGAKGVSGHGSITETKTSGIPVAVHRADGLDVSISAKKAGDNVQRIFFRIAFSTLVAWVGFIIAAFTHPAVGMIAAIILFLIARLTLFLTRKRRLHRLTQAQPLQGVKPTSLRR